MIFEALYGNIKNTVCFLLGLLPDVDVSFMDSWNYIKGLLIDIFTGLGCLIPFGSLFPLISCSLSLWLFRLIYSVILRIKSFIPTLGGA